MSININKQQKKLNELLQEDVTFLEMSCKDIEPCFKEKNLICLSTSNFYVKYTSVTILSIAKNSNPNSNYELAILTNDLTIYNKIVLTNIIKPYSNFCIKIYNISEKIQDLHFYTWAHFTINTYFRLLIPSLFRL